MDRPKNRHPVPAVHIGEFEERTRNRHFFLSSDCSFPTADTPSITLPSPFSPLRSKYVARPPSSFFLLPLSYLPSPARRPPSPLFLSLTFSSRLPSPTHPPAPKAGFARLHKHLDPADIPAALAHRSQLINVWKPLGDPEKTTVEDWPLAIADANSVKDGDKVSVVLSNTPSWNKE